MTGSGENLTETSKIRSGKAVFRRGALFHAVLLALFLSLAAGRAMASTGTITYSGTIFVDDGYGSGTAGDGVMNGSEAGAPYLNNINVAYTLSDGSTGAVNTNTNYNGAFTASIYNITTGVSLVKLVVTPSSNYNVSGGSTGSAGGTFTASGATGTMVWAAGVIVSGNSSGTASGGYIGLVGNTSVGGYVFMNNGPLAGEAANQNMDSDEPGFTAFAVSVQISYTDPLTSHTVSLTETTNTSTGAYPSFKVPRYTSGLTFVLGHTQFVNAGYFINAITDPGNGASSRHIGDENCNTTSITGEYGNNTQGYSPCFAVLDDTKLVVGTINNAETAINFGAVQFNPLTLVSSTPVVASGSQAIYEYQYTSNSSDMRMQFAVTGGNKPYFYIKESTYQAPDCTQSYDTSTNASSYLNWTANVLPNKVVCIEVVDNPTSNGTADQVTLTAMYQYNTTNNPWTRAAGTSSTTTSVTGYAVSGTVFLDDGKGSGTANDGIKQTSESYYSGATVTASYTYLVNGTSTAGSASTTTDGSGAFSILVPIGATGVTITRSSISGYIGTAGSGGTLGTYARGTTIAAGDTVTISTLSSANSGIRFGVVPVNALVSASTATTSPNTTIYYTHTYTAYSTGYVTFSTSHTGISNVTMSVLVNSASDCSGTYTAKSTVTGITGSVNNPTTLCVELAVTVPSGASGTDVETLTATYSYTLSGTTQFTFATSVSDTTTVSNTISGNVYLDADHNSTLGASESNYTGSTTLYVKMFLNGATTATSVATVSSTGTYSISAPSAGSYILYLSTDSTTAKTSLDTGPTGYLLTQNSTGYSFTYSSGSLSSINFGLYYGSVLNGYLFIDNGAGSGTASDGIKNGTEAGYTAASVTIGVTYTISGTQTTTSVSTSTTDGSYTLYVPGTASTLILTRPYIAGYYSTKATATPSGTYSSGGTVGADTYTFTSLSAGTTVTGAYFGILAGYQMSGSVFVDDGTGSGIADNGVKDGGEAYYTGAAQTISLVYTPSGGTATTATATTTSTGAFSFTIPSGSTSVVVTRAVLSGYMGTGGSTGTGTYALGGSPSAVDTITVGTPSASVTTMLFGIAPYSTVSGLVFVDNGAGTGGIAGDGVKNGTEAGYTTSLTIGVKYLPNGASTATTATVSTSASTGAFTLYVPATVTNLVLTRPAVSGYVGTGAATSGATGTYVSGGYGAADTLTIASLSSGTTVTGPYFGIVQYGTLSGVVFVDNGAGSGTANDGVQNGSEAGYALGSSLTVSYTPVGGSAKTLSATVGSSGTFSFTLTGPISALSITRPGVSGYIGTGATISSGSTGTYTRGAVGSSDVLTFTLSTSSPLAAGTNVSGIDFGMVPIDTLTSGSTAQGLAQQTLYFAHQFVSNSAGSVTFSTSQSSSWTAAVYRDTTSPSTCSSTYTAANFSLVSSALTVATGDKVCLLVAVTIPSSGTGSDVVTLVSSVSYTNASPTLTLTVPTASDTATLGTSNVTITKTPSAQTVYPGGTIAYTITVANSGTMDATAVSVSDDVPTNATYVSASCPATLPTGVTACSVTSAPSVGGTGSVTWTLTGTLASGSSCVLTMNVKVD